VPVSSTTPSPSSLRVLVLVGTSNTNNLKLEQNFQLKSHCKELPLTYARDY